MFIFYHFLLKMSDLDKEQRLQKASYNNMFFEITDSTENWYSSNYHDFERLNINTSTTILIQKIVKVQRKILNIFIE